MPHAFATTRRFKAKSDYDILGGPRPSLADQMLAGVERLEDT